MDVYYQYLGNETPDVVRKRIQELLYSWKVGLPNEPKIAEAYEMLKKQGTDNIFIIIIDS